MSQLHEMAMESTCQVGELIHLFTQQLDLIDVFRLHTDTTEHLEETQGSLLPTTQEIC